jgi:hypothetical protein
MEAMSSDPLGDAARRTEARGSARLMTLEFMEKDDGTKAVWEHAEGVADFAARRVQVALKDVPDGPLDHIGKMVSEKWPWLGGDDDDEGDDEAADGESEAIYVGATHYFGGGDRWTRFDREEDHQGPRHPSDPTFILDALAARHSPASEIAEEMVRGETTSRYDTTIEKEHSVERGSELRGWGDPRARSVCVSVTGVSPRAPHVHDRLSGLKPAFGGFGAVAPRAGEPARDHGPAAASGDRAPSGETHGRAGEWAPVRGRREPEPGAAPHCHDGRAYGEVDHPSAGRDGSQSAAQVNCGNVDLVWPLVLTGTRGGTCVGGGEPVGAPSESEVVAQEVGGPNVFGAAADLRGIAVVERARDRRVPPRVARALGGG